MNDIGNILVTPARASPNHTVRVREDLHLSVPATTEHQEPEIRTAGELQGSADSKRRPGRPKGYPRTGGRRRGTPNKLTGDVKQYILREGRVLERLFKIARGQKVRASRPDGAAATIVPPLDAQIRALIALLDRAVPSLKSQEISGKDGEPLIPPSPATVIETGRRICFILNAATRAAASGTAQAGAGIHQLDGGAATGEPAQNAAKSLTPPGVGPASFGVAPLKDFIPQDKPPSETFSEKISEPKISELKPGDLVDVYSGRVFLKFCGTKFDPQAGKHRPSFVCVKLVGNVNGENQFDLIRPFWGENAIADAKAWAKAKVEDGRL